MIYWEDMIKKLYLCWPGSWQKATWLHLRFPFSFFLLPVFLFAWSIFGPKESWFEASLAFFILHFLLYPASNGYNSFFDKDEGSIGGLKSPPKVSEDLHFAAWTLDIIALILSIFLGKVFFLGVLIYGIVSKLYSHPAIRLKKYPFVGWFIAGIFQGGFTFWMVAGIWTTPAWAFWDNPDLLWGILLATAIFFGPYPMTQIYQHEEDSKRGDRTISLVLGIRGTFLFTMIFFGLAMSGLAYFFWQRSGPSSLMVLALCMSPVLIFFFYWMWQTWQDENKANFENTMRLNLISSACMALFFIWVGFF